MIITIYSIINRMVHIKLSFINELHNLRPHSCYISYEVLSINTWKIHHIVVFSLKSLEKT